MSKALKRYLRTRPTVDEIEALFAEMKSDGPRGCALAGASFVEDLLRGVLAFQFDHMSIDELDELFQGTGALSTFSAMIKVAYATKVIGKKTRHDLDIIREIRNAFAHSIRQLSFDTREIADMVSNLNALKDVHVRTESVQDQFIKCVRTIMLHLTKAMYDPGFIKVTGIDHLD